LSLKQGELAGHLHLGYLEAKSGNYPQAIEHCRKVVETEPTNVVALNNLAYLLADHTDQPDEALKYAQRAAELAPDNLIVEGTIGWAYYRKGVYDTALKYLEKAVSTEGAVIREGSVIRKYHLAMAYLKNGERERGLKILETALKSDPNLPEAKIAQEVMLETRK